MPKLLQSDICILGAGPAGLTAAIHLGRMGIPCMLIDATGPSRDKICGDGLSGKVLSVLGQTDPILLSGLGTIETASPSYAVRFYSPRLRMAEIGFQSSDPLIPPGFVCRRKIFDQFLLEKATAFPTVSYHSNTLIDRISRDGEKFRLASANGELEVMTPLLLMATGSGRKVIHQVMPAYPGMEEEGIGVRAYFDHVTGSDQKNAIEIHFLRELLPWYLWIFPFGNGSANVGLALPMALAKKSRESLKGLLLTLIKKYPYLRKRFSGATMHGRIEAQRLPYFTGRMSVSGDNYMLLGDAAHLVDPFTGEGISNAMYSGMIAANAAARCLEKRDYSHSATTRYEEALYDKLGEELELGKQLQELARKPMLLNLVIGRASKNEKVRQMLEEMLYSMNSKGKLSQPMFYLKLLLGI